MSFSSPSRSAGSNKSPARPVARWHSPTPRLPKKLNITDAQKDEIKSINDESNAAVREIFQGFQDDREGTMKKIAEHRKETLGKVVAKLNDEQQKTWKEMVGAPFELKIRPLPREQLISMN